VIIYCNLLKVEDQLPHRSRRIQNLPPVTFEPPPPLRRRRIDATSSFEPAGLINLVGEPDPKENMAFAPITMRVEDLQVEGFVRHFNPPLNGDNTAVVVQILGPREHVDNSYRISRGLVMDDLEPL